MADRREDPIITPVGVFVDLPPPQGTKPGRRLRQLF
jgi:hypothetical protein